MDNKQLFLSFSKFSLYRIGTILEGAIISLALLKYFELPPISSFNLLSILVCIPAMLLALIPGIAFVSTVIAGNILWNLGFFYGTLIFSIPFLLSFFVFSLNYDGNGNHSLVHNSSTPSTVEDKKIKNISEIDTDNTNYLESYIKKCNIEISEVQESFLSIETNTDLSWFFEMISKNIVNRKEDLKNILEKEPNLLPRKLILCLISERALDFILSGQYHIYRGALNMEGRDIQKLHKFVNIELVKMSAMKKEICDDNILFVEEEIQKLG